MSLERIEARLASTANLNKSELKEHINLLSDRIRKCGPVFFKLMSEAEKDGHTQLAKEIMELSKHMQLSLKSLDKIDSESKKL